MPGCLLLVSGHSFPSLPFPSPPLSLSATEFLTPIITFPREAHQSQTQSTRKKTLQNQTGRHSLLRIFPHLPQRDNS